MSTGGIVCRPIAVYGASGYTGRHIAQRLVARGVPALLVGRDLRKLEHIAGELGGAVPVALAELGDRPALQRALDGCAAVISAAGPFHQLGRPVVEAAIATGVHYLDVSGEQAFIDEIFGKWGDAAARAGIALIPAVGIDSVPADMLAALAARGMGRLDAVTVVIEASGARTNSGSLLTMLDAARRRDGVAYRDGRSCPAPRRLDGGTWDLNRSRRVRLMRFDGAEIVLLPRHLQTDAVDVFFTAGSQLPSWLPQRTGLVLMASLRALAQTPAYPGLRPMLSRLPSPRRDIDRISVEVELRGAVGARRGFLTSRGGYRFTAVAAVEAAVRASSPGFTGTGPLTPAQAFDPESFLGAIAADEVRWQVDPEPRTIQGAAECGA
jgi:Saccharopine dehydrogenase NADP binding domain